MLVCQNLSRWVQSLNDWNQGNYSSAFLIWKMTFSERLFFFFLFKVFFRILSILKYFVYNDWWKFVTRYCIISDVNLKNLSKFYDFVTFLAIWSHFGVIFCIFELCFSCKFSNKCWLYPKALWTTITSNFIINYNMKIGL